MAESLRSKTVFALSWSFLESIGLQSVRFVIGIVMARLLLPEQFGLIGMLLFFMGVAQVFYNSGFGAALVQKQGVTPADVNSVFYFNIFAGAVAAGLLCLAAPWIAAFYRQPILTPLTRALSLTIVFNSFGLIQNTLLTKELNFKTLAKVNLCASLLSGAIGVAMAAAGFGVWSLALQQISSSLLQTAFLWSLRIWRPERIFSLTSLREMFRFGSRLLTTGLLHQTFENIYPMVIGRLFSAADLGYFTRAQNFGEIPSQTLSTVVGRVTFPVFSTIQDDPARLKKGMKKALTILVLINFPLMIGLAVVARPLVLVLITEKWAQSITYLQLLCVVGLLYPVHVINLNLLYALGRSDIFLKLDVIKRVLMIANIAVTWRWGISALIYGMIFQSVLSYYLNSYYTRRLIGYPATEQLRDLFPFLLASAAMGAAVHAVGFLKFANLYSMLAAQVAAGVVAYFALCRLFRLGAFMEVFEEVKGEIVLRRARAANRSK